MATVTEVLNRLSDLQIPDALLDPTTRKDFVYYIWVRNGQLQGEPVEGNPPRIDPISNIGLCTDAKIKRMIRDWVFRHFWVEEQIPGYDIYVRRGIPLNDRHRRAYEEIGVEPQTRIQADEDAVGAAHAQLIATYYDIMMNGAIAGTKVNAGTSKGPIQFAMPESVEPIYPQVLEITRNGVTTRKEKETHDSTMGIRYISTGLYEGTGVFNPKFAAQRGVTEDHMRVFWTALIESWQDAWSSISGPLSLRKVFVFNHDNAYGRTHMWRLHERVQARRVTPDSMPARRFQEYAIEVNTDNWPRGVELIRLVD